MYIFPLQFDRKNKQLIGSTAFFILARLDIELIILRNLRNKKNLPDLIIFIFSKISGLKLCTPDDWFSKDLLVTLE